MAYFIGMDLGASSTKAVLYDGDGHLLMRTHGGPSNHVTGPAAEPKMRRALNECLLPMMEQVGTQIDGLCLGVTGLGIPGKRELIKRVLAETCQVEQLVMVNDAEVALAAAMAGGPGIIVIAGTGSIAMGLGQDGRTAKAGGFGYLLGDEGGGYDIARRAMAAALRAADQRGQATQLGEKFQQHFELEHIKRLPGTLFVRQIAVEEIASLTRLVAAAAQEGDAVAQEILTNAGRELGLLGFTVAKQLTWDQTPIPIAPIGGVWQSGPWVSDGFRSALDTSGFTMQIVRPAVEPKDGAAILAARACGWDGFQVERREEQ